MARSLKRWWYVTHRWLGIALCLLFAMWFVSGMVMMYVGYPKLTAHERLAHLPALQSQAGLLPPQQALHLAGWQQPLEELRLSASRAGQPVYQLTPVKGTHQKAGAGTVVVDARTGRLLPAADEATALASAAAWVAAGSAGTSSRP